MDKLDQKLKSHLTSQNDAATAKRLNELEREGVSEGPEVPRALKDRAKDLFKEKHRAECPHCGKAITPFKKPVKRMALVNFLWLGLSAAGFGLSFMFPHYFMQCLALGVLAGAKWIADQRALKTQILIYKALQEEKEIVLERHGLESHRQ
jgi:hypothetical protein